MTDYYKSSAEETLRELQTSPPNVLLSCNHVYNQFIFIDDHAENLRKDSCSIPKARPMS